MHFGFRNIMGDGKTAIITGVTGQDGSYLAELLLAKGYHVYGLVRRTSQPTQGRSLINHLLKNERFHLVNGDLTDQSSIDNAVNEIQPDEFYNLELNHSSQSLGDPHYDCRCYRTRCFEMS